MPDTLAKVAEYDAVRIEYDAFRVDYEYYTQRQKARPRTADGGRPPLPPSAARLCASPLLPP